jgi:hypothetical protein
MCPQEMRDRAECLPNGTSIFRPLAANEALAVARPKTTACHVGSYTRR